MSVPVEGVWPSWTRGPTTVGWRTGVRPDIAKKLVVAVDHGQPRVQLGDDQDVAPLGEATRAVEERFAKGSKVSPLEVVHLYPLVFAVRDVKLWPPGRSTSHED